MQQSTLSSETARNDDARKDARANISSKTGAGFSAERVEDHALLTGSERFMDDVAVQANTLSAVFVRSPHAHARINAIRAEKALRCPGVKAVITGEDIARYVTPFVVGVKAPMKYWPLARDQVRYHGEPVAIILAQTPYQAEDGAACVEIDYDILPVVVDPLEAIEENAPLLHRDIGSNVIADRSFCYGDPAQAFKDADHICEITIEYPRNSVTPIECYGVVADYHEGECSYEVTSNFQGPFALHPVMALSLQVPANRLRLKSPRASGGSFGTKQGVFTAIVALCAASRIVGQPVKWIEDRLEHLMAATSATNRVTTLKAAVDNNGKISALDWDQIDDCGAYLRAPEPATLYRMHGNMTGAYDIRHVAIRNRNVLTNKTPSGLVRGFGGPQVYFALERLVQQIARKLGRCPLEIIETNLIAAQDFPYRTASGGVYDSGDYQKALQILREKDVVGQIQTRRDAARAAGRLYGIGYAAIVEPSISNMGYITTVLTPAEREKAGPKGGAVASASVSLDALGGISVHVASVPQGQGHRTVLAQVVSDVFGVRMGDIAVNTQLDTNKDAWSVASGNYSSRFAGAVAGTAHLAAQRLRDRVAEIASAHFNCTPDEIIFEQGKIAPQSRREEGVAFRRLAATSHWAQATLPQGMDPVMRETAFWSPECLTPPNAQDEINSSAAHGFVFDICGVEICPDTGRIEIDRYVTLHDAGRLLNPAHADGQVRGGFSNAIGAALYEHFVYGKDGSFQAGTFADYLVPTAMEVPDIEIIHMETPSPITPLGAKGIGEGNCMSTPVCLANAVADALGVDDIALPLSPAKILSLLEQDEPQAPLSKHSSLEDLVLSRDDYGVTGTGSAVVAADAQKIWTSLLNPEILRSIIPGCQTLEEVSPQHFKGEIVLGVGIVKGVFKADIKLLDLDEPHSVRLIGEATGPLGSSRGEGAVALRDQPEGSEISYRYGVDLSGKVAAIGGRMIEGAARLLIAEFFQRLSRHAAPEAVVLKNDSNKVFAFFQAMLNALGALFRRRP